MKKIVAVQIVIFLLAVAPGSNIFSQQGRGLGPCGLGLGPGHFQNCRFLDLTDEQADQMKEIRQEHWEAVKSINQGLIEVRTEYRELIAAEGVDMNAIDRNIDQQTDLQNKLMKENARFRKKIEGVLTEEQKELLDSEFSFGRNRGRWNPHGTGYGRGYGYGYGRGSGRGPGMGYGRGYGRGFGPGGIW